MMSGMEGWGQALGKVVILTQGLNPGLSKEEMFLWRPEEMVWGGRESGVGKVEVTLHSKSKGTGAE